MGTGLGSARVCTAVVVVFVGIDAERVGFENFASGFESEKGRSDVVVGSGGTDEVIDVSDVDVA